MQYQKCIIILNENDLLEQVGCILREIYPTDETVSNEETYPEFSKDVCDCDAEWIIAISINHRNNRHHAFILNIAENFNHKILVTPTLGDMLCKLSHLPDIRDFTICRMKDIKPNSKIWTWAQQACAMVNKSVVEEQLML